MGWTATTGYQQICSHTVKTNHGGAATSISKLVGRFAVHLLCYLLPLLALFQRRCPHSIRFFDEFINCLVQCRILQILHQCVCTGSTSKLEVKPRALLHTLLHIWVPMLEPNPGGILMHVGG